MPQISTLMASAALILAALAFYQSRPDSALVHTASSPQPAYPLTDEVTRLLNEQNDDSLINGLNLQAAGDLSPQAVHQLNQQLSQVLQRIEQRLQRQNQALLNLQASVNELKTNVAPSTEAEQEYAQLMKGLPSDYESRLKTDPEYAEQMQKEFRARILDVNVADKERILAVQQLMIISGTIASHPGGRSDGELVSAMLQIADNTDDKSIRIKALESINYLNIDDPALSKRFLDLLANDDNRYVRNLAADTLAVMIYNPDIPLSQRQNLVDKASTLMSQGDNATRELMKQRFGSVQQLQQLAEGNPGEIP